MGALDHLDWPFFEERHRDFARALDAWARDAAAEIGDGAGDVDAACRAYVARLGRDGWLRVAVPEDGMIDLRMLCLAREILARHAVLAEFAFAMQGLGSMPIVLAGSADQKRRYLPPARAGAAIAAFALSEPGAGSDAAALATTALAVPGGWRLDGVKTWISNGGIADRYVVFARSGEAPGARGISAFVVAADTPGFSIAERIRVMAPHPLATLRFETCFVPDSQCLGPPGTGFRTAMATLDLLRPSVGAAALGMARQAFAAALDRAGGRAMFGTRLAEMQLTEARLAEMAVAIDGSAFLVYRAAWLHDRGAGRITAESAMAKMQASEAAQQVIDGAVQLFGAQGVRSGTVVEALYRDIRALRIYDGATELLKLVIGRHLLQRHDAERMAGLG